MKEKLLSLALAAACLSSNWLARPVWSAGNPASDPLPWTPVIMMPVANPQSFRGSDGKFHLVYEIVFVNFSVRRNKIHKVEVLDSKGTVLKALTSKDFAPDFMPLHGSPAGELAEGSVGPMWIMLNFDKAADVPKQIRHRLTVGTPFEHDKEKEYQSEGLTLTVDATAPLVVGLPLSQGKWCVEGSYFGRYGHGRVMLPVKNAWVDAQRYAIDFVGVDDKGHSSLGEPAKNESFVGYGKPVVAVANGTIYSVIDRFPDQKPGAPQGNDRMHYPSGNMVVIDIGNGYYAYYGHLKPGTIKVKEGQKVKRGQQLGELGNSGNSSQPHLHFHVSRSPFVLGTNGVAYHFDSFAVDGRVEKMSLFDMEEAEGKPHKIVASPQDGKHKAELPEEGTLVKLPQ